MLRYRSDLPSLACLLTSVSCQVAWLATGKLVLLVPMVVALRWTALVQHNHSHLALFRRPLANRLVDLTVGTVTGMPMELYREAHARTHHRYLGTPEDWTQPTEVRNGRAVQTRPISRWRYLFAFAPRGWVLSWSSLRKDRTLVRRLAGESAVMVVLVMLSLLAPARLLVVLGLWVVVSLVSADANYKHHNGYLDVPRPDEFANDTFSPLHTTLGFNIGYHSAHHDRPNAHWSKLPDLWARSRATASRQAA